MSTITEEIFYATEKFLVPVNGSSNPALSFTSDHTTGICLDSNQICAVTSSNKRIKLDNSVTFITNIVISEQQKIVCDSVPTTFIWCPTSAILRFSALGGQLDLVSIISGNSSNLNGTLTCIDILSCSTLFVSSYLGISKSSSFNVPVFRLTSTSNGAGISNSSGFILGYNATSPVPGLSFYKPTTINTFWVTNDGLGSYPQIIFGPLTDTAYPWLRSPGSSLDILIPSLTTVQNTIRIKPTGLQASEIDVSGDIYYKNAIIPFVYQIPFSCPLKISNVSMDNFATCALTISYTPVNLTLGINSGAQRSWTISATSAFQPVPLLDAASSMIKTSFPSSQNVITCAGPNISFSFSQIGEYYFTFNLGLYLVSPNGGSNTSTPIIFAAPYNKVTQISQTFYSFRQGVPSFLNFPETLTLSGVFKNSGSDTLDLYVQSSTGSVTTILFNSCILSVHKIQNNIHL